MLRKQILLLGNKKCFWPEVNDLSFKVNVLLTRMAHLMALSLFDTFFYSHHGGQLSKATQ